MFAVTHAVALDVGLGHHVKAILVAQVVPARVVAIVTGTHGVHVQLLHNLDVLNHAFHADDVAVVGIQLVAVGALDEDGLAVDEHLSALDLDASESHTLADGFDDVAFLVLQGEGEGVEVRYLCAPYLDAGNGEGEGRGGATAYADRGVASGAAIRGGKGGLDSKALGCRSGHVNRELAVLVVVDDVLMDEDVLDVCLRTGVEIDFAGNAGEAPEILVFEIGAVAPAHDAHGDEVLLARREVLGKVELGFHLRVLAVADVLAIDPKFKVRSGRAHVEVDVLPLPSSRNCDELAVAARVVVAFLYVGRVALELRVPRVAHVLVDLVAVAFELKEAGYGEIHPLRVIEIRGVEACGRLVVVEGKVETPLAFERKEAVTLGLVARSGLVGALESKEAGARSLGVNTGDVGVQPRFLLVLGVKRELRCHRNKQDEKLSFHCFLFGLVNGFCGAKIVKKVARTKLLCLIL